MSNSRSEDQNQRNTPVMEESPSMRIEFLRARLLSERSVSRTARQRADELAKRVAELEEQLKTVTLQRKKAEKATATVLAILENHGIGDASDGFDSGSDQDATMCESNVSDSKDERKEAASIERRNSVVRDNDGETYSSSEVDSSPSTARSLSWKSDRESLHSSNRKKYTDSSRRSSSFASTGSSSKLVGKSCRRIRRRDTRSSVEESYNDTSMCAAKDKSGTSHTQDLPEPADFGTESLRDSLKNHAENDQLELPDFQTLENKNQVDDGNLNCTYKGVEDMEKALQHQAKLIGQYEAEERAQREWEEKYRESTSFLPDSGDVGNHSDVTEERYDMKASDHPSSAKTLHSQDNESNPEMKCKKTVVSESSSPEFAFPVSKGNWGPVHSENTASANHASDSSDGSNLQKGETSGGKYELSMISHETNKNVTNVLEALEQAKLSLRHKLKQIEGGGSSGKVAAVLSVPAGDIGARAETPVGCPAIFRLPTDLQWATSPKAGYSSLPPQYRVESPECVPNMLFPSQFLDSRSTNSAGNPFSSTEIGSRNVAWRPMIEPGFDTGLPSSTRLNFLDPRPSGTSPFSSNHTFPNYPFSPALVPRLSSPGGFRENEISPATRFSLYDDHIRPHMYR